MNRKKNIFVMVLIGLGWLTAVIFAKGLSTSNRYYQLKPADINRIQKTFSQLQKSGGLNPEEYYTKGEFISELERVLGISLNDEIKDNLVILAEHTTFSKPKIIITLPAILFGSFLWFYLLQLYYPMSFKRMKYLLWLGIIGGLVSGEAAWMTNRAIEEILGFTSELTVRQNPFRTYLIYLLCATGEELWKFLLCYLLIHRSKIFRNSLDGLVLAMIVGLGFATFENIGYVGSYNYDVLFTRYLLSVPAHLCFCGIWGYGMAEARFKRSQSSFSREIWPYLALASAVHFIYNYFFSAGMPVLVLFVLAMLLSMILFFHHQLLKKSKG